MKKIGILGIVWIAMFYPLDMYAQDALSPPRGSPGERKETFLRCGASGQLRSRLHTSFEADYLPNSGASSLYLGLGVGVNFIQGLPSPMGRLALGLELFRGHSYRFCLGLVIDYQILIWLNYLNFGLHIQTLF